MGAVAACVKSGPERYQESEVKDWFGGGIPVQMIDYNKEKENRRRRTRNGLQGYLEAEKRSWLGASGWCEGTISGRFRFPGGLSSLRFRMAPKPKELAGSTGGHMTFTGLDPRHGCILLGLGKAQKRRMNYHDPLHSVRPSAGSRWRFVAVANGRGAEISPVMRGLLTSWQEEQFAVWPWWHCRVAAQW